MLHVLFINSNGNPRKVIEIHNTSIKVTAAVEGNEYHLFICCPVFNPTRERDVGSVSQFTAQSPTRNSVRLRSTDLFCKDIVYDQPHLCENSATSSVVCSTLALAATLRLGSGPGALPCATAAAAVAGAGLGSGSRSLLPGGRLAELAVHHGTAATTVGEEDAKEHHHGGREEDGTQHVLEFVGPRRRGLAGSGPAGHARRGKSIKISTEARIGRSTGHARGNKIAGEGVVGIVSGRRVVCCVAGLELLQGAVDVIEGVEGVLVAQAVLITEALDGELTIGSAAYVKVVAGITVVFALGKVIGQVLGDW